MVRQRGADWGLTPAEALGERVAWHEVKSAVLYRLEQAGRTAGGRGLIVDKSVVAYQGEPLEFGRRVQVEAYRRGLGQAKAVYVVADGAVWIWNVQDRIIYGRWRRPCIPTKPNALGPGSNPCCISCGTDRSKTWCGDWNNWRDAAPSARSPSKR
jgi:hypothetical protein